jgi:nucleoside-diphosphate-sugar epimerase
MSELLVSDALNIDLTDGKQIRDFIFVEDVASAIIAVLNGIDAFPIGTSNVDCGSGCPTSIKEFMLLLKRVSGANTNLNFGALELRTGESTFCVAEITKLVSLGWKPKVSLEVGLKRVVESRMQS